jgi:hypothetical protein
MKTFYKLRLAWVSISIVSCSLHENNQVIQGIYPKDLNKHYYERAETEGKIQLDTILFWDGFWKDLKGYHDFKPAIYPKTEKEARECEAKLLNLPSIAIDLEKVRNNKVTKFSNSKELGQYLIVAADTLFRYDIIYKGCYVGYFVLFKDNSKFESIFNADMPGKEWAARYEYITSKSKNTFVFEDNNKPAFNGGHAISAAGFQDSTSEFYVIVPYSHPMKVEKLYEFVNRTILKAPVKLRL